MNCNIINKFKFISFLAIVSSILLTSPSYAADELSISTPGNVSTSYGAEIPSNFQLAIPKKITLAKSIDGEHYSADYNVIMRKCDLQPTQKVKVSSPTMFDIIETSTSATMPATNDMDTSKDGNDGEVFFVGKLTDSATSGHIETDKLSAGNWNANVTFNINLEGEESHENLYDEITLKTIDDIYDIAESITVEINGEKSSLKDAKYNINGEDIYIIDFLETIRRSVKNDEYGEVSETDFPENMAILYNLTEERDGIIDSIEIPSIVTKESDGKQYKVTAIGYVNNAFFDFYEKFHTGEIDYDSASDEEKTAFMEICNEVNDGDFFIDNVAVLFNLMCDISNLTLPNSLKTIGSFAFSRQYGSIINLPDSIEKIAPLAFGECEGINWLIIPDTVQYIGIDAFDGIQIIEYNGDLRWNDNNKYWGAYNLISDNKNTIVLNDCLLDIFNIPTEGDVVIPEFVTVNGKNYKVTGIGSSAFYGCTNLASIELPSGVTSIGYEAFECCTNLASIKLPSGITSIGEYAFRSCRNLALTELPSGVTSIGGNAFSYCTGIEALKIPNTVAEIGTSAFENVKHIEYHGSATGAPWGAQSMN